MASFLSETVFPDDDVDGLTLSIVYRSPNGNTIGSEILLQGKQYVHLESVTMQIRAVVLRYGVHHRNKEKQRRAVAHASVPSCTAFEF